ncbi:MAG: hypothetical protein ACYTXA_05730 [Nostoc sp.]
MVICERRLWNQTTIEVRFYISSLEHDTAVLAHAVRSHWWVLDMTFHVREAALKEQMLVVSLKIMPLLIFLFYGVYL